MSELEDMVLLRGHVQTLTQLGLSQRQARVYLALLISGTSTAKTISRVSKVPRQDVYTVMPILEKMGLSEKTITKPVMFRATPMQRGLELLLQRKSTEYNEIETKTRNLLRDLKHYNRETTYQEEKTQFFLLPERQERVLRIEEAVSKARTIVDSFTTLEIFRQVIASSERVLKKTVKRGVAFRFLMEETRNNDFQIEIPETILENPCFEIRYVTVPIPAAAVLVDRKEIFFGTALDFKKATYLWSNNPYLVGIIQNHFETIWKSASRQKGMPLKKD